MTTNEFERDLNDQAGLKRPGRIDLRVFQNTADAGDGHPGLQRCFRNYLHEGGMEEDLDLIGYSIKGTSVLIDNAELQQLSTIGTATILGTQWAFLGNMDQDIITTSSPTFVGLTLSADVVTTSTFDGVDVGDLKTAFDNHKASSGVDHTYINQDLRTSFSPTFVGLTLSANLITSSTIDSVNVSSFKSDYDTHKASTGVDHTYIDQSITIASSPRFVNLNIEGVMQHFGDVDNEIAFGIGTQTFQIASSETIIDLNTSGLRVGGANVRVTGIIDNDALGTSDVVLCTQGNVKAYADAKISDAIYGSGWSTVTTVAPSKKQVYTKIETLPSTLDARTAAITLGTGAVYNGDGSFKLDAVGDSVFFSFFCDSSVDTSKQITLYIIYENNIVDAAGINMQLRRSITKTDGSENISLGVGSHQITGANTKVYVKDYGSGYFSPSGIDANDIIVCEFDMDEGSRDLDVYHAVFIYYKKTV